MSHEQLKQDFLLLLQKDGAFDRLEKAVLEIREVLRKSKLSPEQESQLGHGGLPGEYSNSLWPAYKRGATALKNGEHSAIIDSIKILFISLAKSSQLSISLNNSTSNDIPLFSVMDAIPRQIILTREWLAGTENVSKEDKQKVAEALNVSVQAFEEIMLFKVTNQPEIQVT